MTAHLRSWGSDSSALGTAVVIGWVLRLRGKSTIEMDKKMVYRCFTTQLVEKIDGL